MEFISIYPNYRNLLNSNIFFNYYLKKKLNTNLIHNLYYPEKNIKLKKGIF